VLGASGLLDTLLSGGVPVVCVALATAVVTVWSERRKKSKAKDEELAKLKEVEIPEWGKTLQQDVGRMTRSLYGDAPWGGAGFFAEFGEFKTDVLGALRDLNGDPK
jgi:hypothetical protein